MEAPKLSTESIDKKDLGKFSTFFNETFKVLFSLMEKNRAQTLLSSVFTYLQRMTENNLYYSKIIS